MLLVDIWQGPIDKLNRASLDSLGGEIFVNMIPYVIIRHSLFLVLIT